MTKTADAGGYSKVGDVITYTIVATNDGNVTQSGVTVTDNPALDGFGCSPAIPATLAPTKSVRCTGTHTIGQGDLDAGHVDDSACASAATPGTNAPCKDV